MATTRGIEATAEAIRSLLRDRYVPADFSQPLEFEVFQQADFLEPPFATGASVFVHRATINGTARHPRGRVRDDGRKEPPKLPVDAHLLLTAWGKTAGLQLAVLGWAMRVLEDHPILPQGLLNRGTGDVFFPGEAVEVGVDDMPNDELLHLWELLAPQAFQPSVPYIARTIFLESDRIEPDSPPVQERVGRYGVLRGPA
jgi:uncharacterized protein DUF4255